MIDLDISENLKNLVKDKKVAFVGPAPYLVGQDLGPLLDRYDLICRVNDIIPPPAIRKDYGSRTDIMFHNLGTPFREGLNRKIENYPDYFEQLKMVVCPVIKSDHSETNYLSWPDDHVSNVVRNFSEINVHNIPFSWIGVKSYKKLYGDIGVEFNSGVGGIMMLLNCPLEELFITGFTFYLGGNTPDDLYYDGHWDETELSRTTVGINGGHGHHANILQIAYIRDLIMSAPTNLKIDSYLSNLLEI